MSSTPLFSELTYHDSFTWRKPMWKLMGDCVLLREYEVTIGFEGFGTI